MSWNSDTEQWLRTWSDQFKVDVSRHYRSSSRYRRWNFAAGTVGSLSGVTTVFGLVAALLLGNSCDDTTTTTALKIVGICLSSIFTAAMGVMVLQQPAALAERHTTTAKEYDKLWRRIDMTMLVERQLRPPYAEFIRDLVQDRDKLFDAAPPLPGDGKPETELDLAAVIHSTVHGSRRHTVSEIVVHVNDERKQIVEAVAEKNQRRFDRIRRSASATELDKTVARAAECVERGEPPPPRAAVSDGVMHWFRKRVGLVETD